MTTSGSPPSPWRRRALVAAVVAVFLSLGLVCTLVFNSFSSPHTPTPVQTDGPAPLPTVSSTPTEEAVNGRPAQGDAATELAVPPSGDARGCPANDANGTIDRTDPYCKKRRDNEAFNRDYANNPAYKCEDGRNNGLGADSLDKFVPCINGSLRLEIGNGGTVTLYQSTSSVVEVQRNVGSAAEKPNMTYGGKDWVIRQTVDGSSDRPTHRIQYFHNPDLTYFATYVRKGTTGEWRLLADPDDEVFDASAYYQVVVFWNDPRKPRDDAPLPPGFQWTKVQKHA